MQHFIVLFGAGLAAGIMNALAGGGSFVSLPAMIAVGIPPVEANASTTVALLPGSVTSAWLYREELGPIGKVPLSVLAAIMLAGGITGALLLLWLPSATFDVALPWLMLLATVMLGFGRRLGEWMRSNWKVNRTAVMTMQFVLGLYGGYFGGAVGLMLMAVWGLIDGRELKSFNAPRTFLVSSANAIASVVFILAHAVRWPETLVMLVGSVVGGYGGAIFGKGLPAAAVRVGTLALAAAITVVFFVRAYG